MIIITMIIIITIMIIIIVIIFVVIIIICCIYFYCIYITKKNCLRRWLELQGTYGYYIYNIIYIQGGAPVR